ncbi:uncharacterized protein LOC119571358 [Penaeus monodon]|uniref:uncharacterized protein LOC119571358 n=1 Tax=Penaeus monodon TaxID=6687 RepID=UPI0018A750F0|nr:uncharacterized protein LOC119571358 [Penaeus monodon]
MKQQPGTTEAYRELFKDLMQAKLKYQQTMDSLLGGSQNSQIHTVDGIVGQNGEPLDTTTGDGTGDTWPVPRTVTVTAPTVPSATLPTVSATTTVTTIAASQVQQNPGTAAAATSTADGNNQETSIFIEAMEAILNSQM